MKTGDKLYCIKTLKHKINDNTSDYFIKNKIYYILDQDEDFDRIKLPDENNTNWFFYIKSQKHNKYKLNEYFITEKQLRKQKLLKINQTR